VFNMIFTYRYCRMLEEGSFRGKTADFIMMFIFGAVFMIIFAFFINLLFLGQAFTIMLVYIWSRRNPLLRFVLLTLYRKLCHVSNICYLFQNELFRIIKFSSTVPSLGSISLLCDPW